MNGRIINVANMCLICLHYMIINGSLSHQFPCRTKRTNRAGFAVLSGIFLGLAEYFTVRFCDSFLYYFLLMAALYILYGLLGFIGEKLLILVTAADLFSIKVLLVALGDVIAMHLTGASQPLESIPHLISQGLIALFLVPVAFFVSFCRIGQKQLLTRSVCVLCVAQTTVLLIALLLLALTLPGSVGNFGYNLAMIVIILLSYYLLCFLLKTLSNEMEYQVRLEKIRYEENYKKQVESAYQELRKLRHDYQNHLTYMQLLLEANHYEELKDYFSELLSASSQAKRIVDSGNPVVNAVINSKAVLAESRQISFEVKASLPENIPLSSTELVSLFSNMLDNAFEAAKHADKAWVELNVRPVKGFIRIDCSNSAKGSLTLRNGIPRSSKKDAESHGMGMQIMKKITEDHGGVFDFHFQESVFSLSILLPLVR